MLEGKRRVRVSRAGCRRKAFRSAKRSRCFRYRSVGSLVRPVKRLVNETKFSGRLGNKVLRAGLYRAIARATDAAGNRSKPRRTHFKILHARR